MKGRKSPGPNGLQACPLQKYCHILGQKVANMVLGILNHSDDISALNGTHIP